MPPRRLLIVAHAPSPNTRQLLDAVVAGARSPEIGDVEVRVTAPLQAGADDVLAAEALILGTTENLGYMSGALKDFFDRIYYPCLEKTQGLPYALYIRAGHDGTGTRRGVETIVTGLRWRAVREPLICRGEWRARFRRAVRRAGDAGRGGPGGGHLLNRRSCYAVGGGRAVSLMPRAILANAATAAEASRRRATNNTGAETSVPSSGR